MSDIRYPTSPGADWSTERGVQHLGKFGFFDEVSAGYSWGNSVGTRYLGLEGSVPPATPLLLVYRRSFVEAAPRDRGDAPIYQERDRRLVLAKRGAREIAAWADSGAPLPKIDRAGVLDEDRMNVPTRLGARLLQQIIRRTLKGGRELCSWWGIFVLGGGVHTSVYGVSGVSPRADRHIPG